MVTEKGKSGFRSKALSLLLSLVLSAGLVPMAGMPVWAKTSGNFTYMVENEEKRTGRIIGYTGTADVLEIPGEIDGYSITAIGDRAFLKCTSLTKVIIPNGVTRILGDDFEGAFMGCTSLTEVLIPDSVTYIGQNAFSDCTSLAEILIPENVTYIGPGAFFKCSSLAGIVIPNSVKQIGDYAFQHCTSLTTAVMPESIVSTGEGVFSLCPSLSEIVIPDSVRWIEESAFWGCTALTKMVIPDSVTRIGGSAFADCTGLTEVVIPNSVEKISWYAFENCTGLTEIVIPNGVESISEYAFENCPSLVSITIPPSVKHIGSCALGYTDGWSGVQLENFTITGLPGTAAETYAKENGFTFIELTQLTDPGTGVTLSETQTGFLPAGAQLTVSAIPQSDNRAAYDISLRSAGGEAVQPAGEVQVSLPVPENMEGSRCKVYRLEADGSETDMRAVYNDGKLTFSTDHFSLYVIEEEAQTILPGDLNGDGSVTIQDVMEACKVLARQSAGTAPTAEEMRRGDLDGDYKISITDVMEICKLLARQS